MSESDTPSAVEALEATSTLPTCKELSANWEEEFFSTLSASTSQNSEEDDSDDDIVKNIGTQSVQELFFCDRSIRRTVYSNDFV